MSPALANEAVLGFNVLLILLLAASLSAVIRQPPYTGSTAADDTRSPLPGQETMLAGPGEPLPHRVPRGPVPEEPGRGPLPVRAPGPSGWGAPPPSAPVPRPDGTWRPVVSGGPPWGPAPRPPGLD